MATASYADKIWGDLTKDPNYVLAYPLLIDAIHPLFGEAIRCFNNDNFHAVAALCRSAVECSVFAAAMIYDIEIDSPSNKEGYVYTYKEDDYLYKNTDRPDYGKALLIAKNRKIIDAKLEGIIQSVREDGNFVMHYHTQLKKRLKTLINKALGKKTSGKTNMIITKKEAEISIKNTAETIKQIYTGLLTNPPRFKPPKTYSFCNMISVGLLTIVFLVILRGSSIYKISTSVTINLAITALVIAFIIYSYNEISKLLNTQLSKLEENIARSIKGEIKLSVAVISKRKEYFKRFIKRLIVSTITLGIFLLLFLVVSAAGLAPINYLAGVFGGLFGAWVFILILAILDIKN
jgi:hypothetical protein